MTAKGLRELLASGQFTVEDGALVIARDLDPHVASEQALGTLERLADEVATPLDRHASVGRQLETLREVLYGRFGLRGNTENYDDPQNSVLPAVLERRLGIPISLAVVVMAVSRRAGVVAEGISFPGHFLLRIGGPAGHVVDPFHALTPLGPEELRSLYRRATRTDGFDSFVLRAATSRDIWIRMLSNPRLIFDRGKDHGRSLVVLNRLVELDAGPTAVRDRGLAALELGASAQAEQDLSTYLTMLPRAIDRADVQRALDRARRAPTCWN